MSVVVVEFLPVKNWTVEKICELNDELNLHQTQMRFDIWMMRIQFPEAYAIVMKETTQ